MLYPLLFKPIYKEKIWGGRRLQVLGRKLPSGNIGESWEISCHPNGVSVIANGELAGTELTAVIKQHGRGIIGKDLPQKYVEKFPLLVKLIDANDDLSVQVHPNDEYARRYENGELGKNECWYILDTAPGAKLVYGLQEGVSKEAFQKAIAGNKIETCLCEMEVHPGDIINIPAGMVHAIGKGILLAEIQQSSDTTYRVFDYNRTDDSGKPRELHVTQALDVINFKNPPPKKKPAGLELVFPGYRKRIAIATRYFAIEVIDIEKEMPEQHRGSKFFIYTLIEGNAEIHSPGGAAHAKAGESVLVPAEINSFTVTGNCRLIKSYVPDLEADILSPLQNAGYGHQEIKEKVSGLE